VGPDRLGLAEQGRLLEAEAQFAEAVRIEPISAASRNNLGLVRLDQGHPDRAIPELRNEVARPKLSLP
jgi:predicted Zn-dependent protease